MEQSSRTGYPDTEEDDMKRLKILLCQLGIHKWRLIGTSLFGQPGYLCVRPACRTCYQDMWTAKIFWERDEVLDTDEPPYRKASKEDTAEDAWDRYRKARTTQTEDSRDAK